MAPSPLLEVDGIWKHFGATPALRGVSTTLQSGEILALMGHNGAGKSTLVKILAGALRQDSGEIRMDGTPVRAGVRAAQAAGLAVIYQDLSLFIKLTVAENIAGGLTGKHGYSFRRAKLLATAALDQLEPNSLLRECLERTVGELPLAMQQRVAIARAFAFNSRVLILDEPTAALSLHDADRLLTCVRELASRGTAVLFVSHRLSDVRRVADRYLVLRDGQVALSAKAADVAGQALARAMFGETQDGSTSGKAVHSEARRFRPEAPPALAVRGASRQGEFSDISVRLRAGEIAVITGLTGSGRTEFAESLAGLRRLDCGEMEICGKPARPSGPRSAMRKGLIYVPEDRLRAGLFAHRSIAENILGATDHRRARFGFLRAETGKALKWIGDFGIRCGGPNAPVETLSGGNQQKVLLARWCMAEPRVYVLDEPTSGVDMGAVAEIHHRLRQWAAAGAALLVITSEIDEVLDLADRVLVFHSGSLVLDCSRAELDRERLTAAVLHGGRTEGTVVAEAKADA